MIERIAVNRYAHALLEIAFELKIVDDIEKELKWVDSVLKTNLDMLFFLKNPLIGPGKKKKIIDKVLSAHISLKLKNFFYLLIDKRRVEVLEEVFEEYRKMADERRGVVKADVHAAIKLSPEKVEEIKSMLEKKMNKTVKIEAKIRPEIIGGLLIHIGSLSIDRSIQGRMKEMREKLLSMEAA